MSLLNLHYRKIVGAYFQHLLTPKLSVRFIDCNETWFFRKSGPVITFNTRIYIHVSKISRRDAVNFVDCLMVCCLYYLQQENVQEIKVENVIALRSLNAPFKDPRMKEFLNAKLNFTPKENYRNLELADELETYEPMY